MKVITVFLPSNDFLIMNLLVVREFDLFDIFKVFKVSYSFLKVCNLFTYLYFVGSTAQHFSLCKSVFINIIHYDSYLHCDISLLS